MLPKIILETDMGNDIDDALALAMLHGFAARNECEILAVNVNKGQAAAPRYVDIVNTFYGVGEIPVGWIGPSGPIPEDIDGNFTGTIAAMDYPFTHTYYENPVSLLRQTLISQPDNSVTIVSIGFLTNLSKLLDSHSDDISPLTGKELIRQKVKTFSVMAGNFNPQVLANPSEEFKEYNILVDVPSARNVFANWPGEIIFTGFEQGIAIPYDARCIEAHYRWSEDHPVSLGYRAFKTMPYNRPTWDLIASLWAIRPYNDFFTLSKPGKIEIFDGGYNGFVETRQGSHYYIKTDELQRARIKELFSAICSQPRAKTTSDLLLPI